MTARARDQVRPGVFGAVKCGDRRMSQRNRGVQQGMRSCRGVLDPWQCSEPAGITTRALQRGAEHC